MVSPEVLNTIYTKAELCELLAHILTTGDVPDINAPQSPPSYQTRHTMGRPALVAQAEKLFVLEAILKEKYPLALDIPTLVYYTGMSRTTLVKLQSDPAFLVRIGNPFAGYFSSLPVLVQSRLSTLWRIVYDLHFYQLALANPGIRVPLYQAHSLAWKLTNVGQTAKRDWDERNRLNTETFRTVLLLAGWPYPEPFTKSAVASELDWPCMSGCPVSRAMLEGQPIEHIPTARKVIGPRLPWIITDRLFVSDPKGYELTLRQIIGVN